MVSSLWTVSDRFTYELMTAFYSYLNTRSPEDALKEALVELMKQHPSPYHWPTFYLTGGMEKRRIMLILRAYSSIY